MSVQISIIAKVGRNDETGESITAVANFTVDKLTWLNVDSKDPPIADNTVPNGALYELTMYEDNGQPSKDRVYRWVA